MIKNLVFDFGCILTDLDKDRCVNALHQIGAGRIAYYVDECRQEDLFHTLEMGDSTIAEFCDEARRQSGAAFKDEELVWAWNELITGVPEDKLRFIKQLRASGRYDKIMVLSNTNVIHWEKAAREFFPGGVDEYFDKVFLSCDMHLIKPDAQIYRKMLEQSGCKAEETLFIDDSAANCAGAEALGIKTFHDPKGTEWMKMLK